MPAYVISEVEILRPDLIDACRELAAASIAKYGGHYIVRGGRQTPGMIFAGGTRNNCSTRTAIAVACRKKSLLRLAVGTGIRHALELGGLDMAANECSRPCGGI